MNPRNRRYQPGEYFEQFLSNLPALIQQRENRQLQRERFEYQKQRDQQAFEIDEQNRALRTQQLSAAEAQEKRIKESDESNQSYRQFQQVYNSLSGSPETQSFVVKQHPFLRNNPEIAEKFQEEMDIRGDINQNIGRLYGMKPERGILEARTLVESQYISPKQREELSQYITNAEKKLDVTIQDLKTMPGYINVTRIQNQISSITSGEQDATLAMEARKEGLDTKEEIEQYKQRIVKGLFDNFETAIQELQKQGAVPKGTFPSDTRVAPALPPGPVKESGNQEPKTGETDQSKDQLSLDTNASVGMDAQLADDKIVDNILQGMMDDDSAGAIDFTQPFEMSVIPQQSQQEIMQQRAAQDRESFLNSFSALE
tara:strand:- start:3645 stop:4757 length:1113 start_codon:yes stop_codon:yes gene_type:complete